MEKIKNFIYNNSDIVFGLIVLLLTGFLIFSGVKNILEYPKTLVAKEEKQVSQQKEKKKTSETPKTEATPETPATPQPAPETPKTKEMVTITIPDGLSTGGIANLLKENGLITDTAGFVNAVLSQGIENQLKSGAFKIPQGSTTSEIITILLAQ